MTDLFQDTKPGKTLQETIWADGAPYLVDALSIPRQKVGALICSWLKQYDHGHVRTVLSRAIKNQPFEPKAYIISQLERLKKEQPRDIGDLSDDALAAKIAHMERYCATRVSPPGEKLLADLRAEAAKRERDGR